MSDEEIEITDLSSVKVLLKDARIRIKECENRQKETMKEKCDAVNDRIDELAKQFNSFNIDISKWIPLLSNLQKADDHKRNLTLLLLVSFITNVATILMSIFIWFVKSGIVK